MRILLFSNWIPPILSGSAFYTASLGQALVEKGHDVLVVTLDWGEEGRGTPEYSFQIRKLPVSRLPRLPVFFNLSRVGFANTSANRSRLKGIIAEFKPDLIHHVNHIFDSTFLSLKAGRESGIPVVGSITTPVQHQNPWLQACYETADRWTVGKFGVCQWDKIISLDKTVHDYVGKVYGDGAKKKSVIVPFGVRLDAMPLYADAQPERRGRPQILMAGHIHPFRNPVQLVRAMPRILESIPNARLVLAGRVDLKEPVHVARQLKLTEDQVQFLGETPHPRIVELMKTSHVFASWVTGPFHSLGTAPMEAMLCQTPVINDLPEDLFGDGQLQNGENIVLVDSKKPDSIAQGIVRLLKDESIRRRIGMNGRKFVEQNLGWPKIAEEMEKIYETLCFHHHTCV